MRLKCGKAIAAVLRGIDVADTRGLGKPSPLAMAADNCSMGGFVMGDERSRR